MSTVSSRPRLELVRYKTAVLPSTYRRLGPGPYTVAPYDFSGGEESAEHARRSLTSGANGGRADVNRIKQFVHWQEMERKKEKRERNVTAAQRQEALLTNIVGAGDFVLEVQQDPDTGVSRESVVYRLRDPTQQPSFGRQLAAIAGSSTDRLRQSMQDSLKNVQNAFVQSQAAASGQPYDPNAIAAAAAAAQPAAGTSAAGTSAGGGLPDDFVFKSKDKVYDALSDAGIGSSRDKRRAWLDALMADAGVRKVGQLTWGQIRAAAKNKPPP